MNRSARLHSAADLCSSFELFKASSNSERSSIHISLLVSSSFWIHKRLIVQSRSYDTATVRISDVFLQINKNLYSQAISILHDTFSRHANSFVAAASSVDVKPFIAKNIV